ncbi:glycosyltransferase family 15 protein [Suillus fuscotomentosus]|uniref:Glycosyltransferase family 15 protein n=1 Tax=Suillus fuscotomentosus TaxID=1912939 RepID=A0AAD4HQU1_9AGAM|nr:glycosyltransferase family 15 protein [Suillus fuscotomentosus]KAG1905608.1 glycosyltransferase family 15 protein [Suillus fuscotomentosus]
MALPLTAAHRRSIVIAVTAVLIVCYFMAIGREDHSASFRTLSTQLSTSKDSETVAGLDVKQTSETPSELSSSLKSKPSPTLGNPIPQVSHPPHRANATLVMLARNSDLNGVISSVEQLEAKFNRKFNYPWVFLNDEPFSTDFKRRVSVLTDADVSFGLVPHEQWVQPDWIDEGRAQEGRNKLVRQGVIYGGKFIIPQPFFVILPLKPQEVFRVSAQHRGFRKDVSLADLSLQFFFRHELLTPYKWYWRVEPDVRYYCDLDYDPFLFLEDHDKIYGKTGFTISMPEWEPTIPSLWSTVKNFVAEYPQYVSPDNSMDFLSDNAGDSYNMCHFWSNFEIADMDFWRGEAYTKFFEYLENTGGFYYERWGDAPVHSIAAALFTRKDQIHFFKDIGKPRVNSGGKDIVRVIQTITSATVDYYRARSQGRYVAMRADWTKTSREDSEMKETDHVEQEEL